MSWVTRILVPVDYSPASEAALRYALLVAEHFGSWIDVLHVLATESDGTSRPIERAGDPESRGSATEEALALRALERWLAERLGEVSAAVRERVRPRVTSGQPQVAIVEVSNEDYDLIAIGGRGGDLSDHDSLGDVVRQVAGHAPCDVVTVWEPESSSNTRFSLTPPTDQRCSSRYPPSAAIAAP